MTFFGSLDFLRHSHGEIRVEFKLANLNKKITISIFITTLIVFMEMIIFCFIVYQAISEFPFWYLILRTIAL